MNYNMQNRNNWQCNMPRGNNGCRNMPGNCNKENQCLDQLPVGMAYVPWQNFQNLYDPHMGLDRGTLFRELDYPFCGKRGI